MDAKLWAGLDVGIYTTSVCIIDDDGSVVAEADIAPNPVSVIEMLVKFPGIQSIALESGLGNHLTRELRKAGFPAVMFDAFQTSRFLAIRRNKTDKNDARGLADVARLGRDTVSEVLIRGLECQSLRSKLRIRRGIIKQRIAAENMLRSQLYEFGKTIPKAASPSGYEAAVLVCISEMQSDGINSDIIKSIETLLTFTVAVRRYNVELNNEAIRLAGKNKVCKRLMTIPGIGAQCALAFYSTIENPHRFSNVADVGAYLGLTPTVRESGGRVARSRITKRGDALTRGNLYIAAQILMGHGYHDSELCQWAVRIKSRIGARRAKVAVARKLAVVMAAVWKSGGNFIAFPQGAPSGGGSGTPMVE